MRKKVQFLDKGKTNIKMVLDRHASTSGKLSHYQDVTIYYHVFKASKNCDAKIIYINSG